MAALINFENWKKVCQATYDAEWQIIGDKLGQGIGGIEWMVLQTLVRETDITSLNVWLLNVEKFKHKDAETVMIDALVMQPDLFYQKYQLNWWISIRDTLTYLNMLRQRNYDRYSDFIRKLEWRC